MLPAGHPQGGLAIAASLLVRVLLISASGWFVVAGLRIDWEWGVGNLCFPPAALAFFYFYPNRAGRPGALFAAGMIAFMVSMAAFRQGNLESQRRGYKRPTGQPVQSAPEFWQEGRKCTKISSPFWLQ